MLGKLLDGRYRVLRTLDAGGFGRTYVAEDIRRPHHPKCVVKHLQTPSTDPLVLENARRLFMTEAEALERLGSHDQIPRLLAAFEEEGDGFFLVQDFIEGRPLSREMQPGRRWAEPQVCQMLREVLNVLVFVHRNGVIHRDIKPDNLIRRHQDGRLVLVDFGSVKQIRSPRSISGRPTVTMAVGTMGYMPSEQAHGKPRMSSDLYALGMIGIQALTSLSPTQLQEDAETGEILWQQYATASPDLTAILTKMVRYHFKDRYQTAQEVLSVLDCLGDRPRALPMPPPRNASPTTVVESLDPPPTGTPKALDPDRGAIVDPPSPPGQNRANPSLGATRLRMDDDPQGDPSPSQSLHRFSAIPWEKTDPEVFPDATGELFNDLAMADQITQIDFEEPVGVTTVDPPSMAPPPVPAPPKQFLRAIVLGIALLGLGTGGWVLWQHLQQQQPHPSSAIPDLKALYDRQAYQTCLSTAQTPNAQRQLPRTYRLQWRDRCYFGAAQQLAEAGDLSQAIRLAALIVPSSDRHAQAKASIERWSQQLFATAHHTYAEEGNLKNALALLQSIPKPAGHWYEQAQQSAQHWRKVDQTNQSLLTRGEQALQQGDWQQALAQAQALQNQPDFPYWQRQAALLITRTQQHQQQPDHPDQQS